MQNETVKGYGQRGGKRSRQNEITPADAIGILEAALEEVAKHFDFTTMNAKPADAVIIFIPGVQRVEDESDGTWSLEVTEPYLPPAPRPATEPAGSEGREGSAAQAG